MGGILERNLIALRDLINRSVEEVRLEAGVPRRESVLLTQLMDEVGQAAAIEAKARNIQFTVTPVEPRLAVEVDRQAIAATLANLLQNAFKFGRSNGHVVLRTDTVTSPGKALIQVEDECGGLAAGEADTLFRPFEQRRADRTGLGLGLTIARRNVEANGGEIHVRNLPGKGCIFTISLPVFQAPGVATDPFAAATRGAPEAGATRHGGSTTGAPSP